MATVNDDKTKDEYALKLIERIKDVHKYHGNINTVTYNGSYELVQTAVGFYAQLDPAKIRKVDLDVIYLLGQLNLSKDSRDTWIGKSNLPQNHKSDLLDINQKWADHGVCEYAAGNGHCGLFRTSTRVLPTVTDDIAKILITMLVNVLTLSDSRVDKMFTIVKEAINKALLHKISGVQAAAISQMLHLLKPNVFPILNKPGQTLYAKTLRLKGLNNVKQIETFADNAKVIYDFREQYLKGVNFRTIDIAEWVTGL
jgi:hypothetical protein